jgi:transposase
LVSRPKSELKEDAIALRRECVLELTSQGYSQRQIENMLNISHGTVNNDQTYLRQKAKENIQSYIEERLPEEYEKCLVGVTSILKEAWNTAQNTNDS